MNISKGIVLILSVLIMFSAPVFSEQIHEPAQNQDSEHHQDSDHDHEGHVAPHGGILSEIESCAVGHVEVQVVGEMLEIWLLDGGSETGRSIQIADARIPLSILPSTGERIEMILIADPMKLAGEKSGKCSHFIGKSEALKSLTSFAAFGWIRFKGQMRPLHITYPVGYEADEEHNCDEEHHHEAK